jgi:hypothetical protein
MSNPAPAWLVRVRVLCSIRAPRTKLDARLGESHPTKPACALINLFAFRLRPCIIRGKQDSESDTPKKFCQPELEEEQNL